MQWVVRLRRGVGDGRVFSGARISLYLLFITNKMNFNAAAFRGQAGRVQTTALALNPRYLRCFAQRYKEGA